MLPKKIQELRDKYGQIEIVRNVQRVPTNQPRAEEEPSYGVCVIVRTREGEYVLVRHSYDLPGISMNDWTIPGGKVETNESFEEAAAREVLEETGIGVKIVGMYKMFHHVHVSDGDYKSEWYIPVFLGEVVSESIDHKSPEILEVKKFKRLPENFAGELRKHYEDLAQTTPSSKINTNKNTKETSPYPHRSP